MTATKHWGQCACGCGQDITEGKEFIVDEGEFYLTSCISLGMLEDFPETLAAVDQMIQAQKN